MVAVAERVTVAAAEGVSDVVAADVPVREVLGVFEKDTTCVLDGDGDTEGVTDGDGECDGVCDGDDVCDGVFEGEPVFVDVCDGV